MFDVSSDPHLPTTPKEENLSAKPETRKFIGVKFNCCGIYVRIYMNKEGTGYEGKCPKCFRPVKFTIGGEGTNHRFFEAY